MSDTEEMSPERLAEVREMCSPLAERTEEWDAISEAISHIDALTADRDEARSEVRALREQRDEIREAHRVEVAALTAKLSALVEAVPAGTTVLCLAMVDACTSCERTFEEPVADDRCPSCGAEWCMTTYVGDPEYRVTHSELGDPKCLDGHLRAARGKP